jgi:hypothetical protein
MAKKKTDQPKQESTDQATIDAAVAEGRAQIEQGKTKIDAAMAIYRLLHDQPLQTVIDAFIQGAGLTPKGALTYWYNCRRKLLSERREAAK